MKSITEKSAFQCADCKSIMKFDNAQLDLGDTWFRLTDDDMILETNQFAIPYRVLVVANVPFCPFCNGKLVILHNRLLDKFHDYLKAQRDADPALKEVMVTLGK